METEAMAQTSLADWLIDQEEVAIRRDDEKSWRKIKAKQARLASMAQLADQMKMKMAGQIPPASAQGPLMDEMAQGEPGVPPEEPPMNGGGGPLPDVGVQGMSMPDYGRPAGTSGGRPPMPPPAPGVGQGGI